MKYELIAQIDPALARRLRRAVTPPGCTYWVSGKVALKPVSGGRR